MPAIVYQSSLPEPAPSRRQPAALWAALEPTASIFDDAHAAGYSTAAIGYYINYGEVLGTDLDYAFSRSHWPKGIGILRKVRLTTLLNSTYLTDPVSVHLGERILPRVYSEHWFSITQEVLARTLEWIDVGARDSLTLVHFPVPHWPFVFNPDGSYFGHKDPALPSERGSASEAGYRRQVAYVDRVVGQIVDKMKRSGSYDSTLLVLTSDHGARVPDIWSDGDLTHVPLLVKLPRQAGGERVDKEFWNYRLRPMMEQVLRGGENSEAWYDEIPTGGPREPVRSR